MSNLVEQAVRIGDRSPDGSAPGRGLGLRDGWIEASARADAAALVRDQIAEYPDTVRMPAGDLELSVVRDFLTAEECAELITIIDANRIP